MRATENSAPDRELPLVGKPDRTAALYRLTDRLYRARGMSDVYDAALDAITESLDCGRASVLLFDSDNVMRFVAWRGLSEQYRTSLEGHTPWKRGEQDPEAIFVSNIDATAENQKVKDTVKDEGIHALAFVPLVAHGGVIGKFMTYYESVREFPEEERALALTIARQVGFSLERGISERRRQSAERELRNSEERFRAMSELAPVMMWLGDQNGKCLHLNRMLRQFWGISAAGLDGFDWRDSMHPDDAPEIGRRMFEALNTRSEVRIQGRYRNTDGEYRILQTDARPRFSEAGEFLGLVGVNIDVTDRERAEAQRDLLLAELSHRVKNMLAVVQAVAHQTFKSAKSTEEAREAFDGRLRALAGAQDLLTRGTRDRASIKEIAVESLQGRSMDASRLYVEGPEIQLASRQAMSLAMALHELCTNATKYGAFSNESGSVELRWKIYGDKVHVLWRELGGPPVTKPSRRGFGSVMIERALSDVGGKAEMAFVPSGLVCELDIPIVEAETLEATGKPAAVARP
jgi:PAS domain S-box-containing protein